MEQVNCLNFCELLPYLKAKYKNASEFYREALQLAGYTSCERIYIGSSFCGKYFLAQTKAQIEEIVELCKNENLKITLELPTFSEGDLENGKRKIKEILESANSILDEITVNDFGMLTYLKNENCAKSINLGRLFMKDYRDPRYEEYFKQVLTPKIFTNYFKKIVKEYEIKCFEFDVTHQIVDYQEANGLVEVAIHVPYCYQTVGRICEYASIHKPLEKKFRANMPCDISCAENRVTYHVEDGNIDYVRYGRTVYFKHPGYEIRGIDKYRTIYFPIEL